jgi:chemotaxis protein MotB
MIRRHSLKLKKKTQTRDHTDDWLMTYADMITLLLCFFAVFLSVSVPKHTLEAMLQKPIIITSGAPDDIEANAPLEPRPHIVVPTSTEIGNHITAMQMSSSAFFASGSATLTEEGKKILANEVAILKAPKYHEYEITVEGHTDDTPVGSGSSFTSNWELSSARASAVVAFFLENGIEPFKLRAAGYADTFPRVPNRDAHGNPIPENQAKNRRVVIKLEKMEQAD